MTRIDIPQSLVTDLPFYLAVEEWVARSLPAGEYFFAWQTEPAVICGRHQDIPSEVDLQAARDAGVRVWRRKSGGGAVLADRNNVMFSYITPSAPVETSFSRYTDMICRMLSTMGIEAAPTGRNDIAINGKKVAGNAFLKLPGRSIVHGTMLYDADFGMMQRLLTPSRAKLQSKGVVSVPSRVTTLLREGIALSLHQFMSEGYAFLCPDPNDVYRLTDYDIKAVGQLRDRYMPSEESRIQPRKAFRTINRQKYFEGAGFVKVEFDLADNRSISNFALSGDFFNISDLSQLTDSIEGARLHRAELSSRIGNISGLIPGIGTGEFVELLINEE